MDRTFRKELVFFVVVFLSIPIVIGLAGYIMDPAGFDIWLVLRLGWWFPLLGAILALLRRAICK